MPSTNIADTTTRTGADAGTLQDPDRATERARALQRTVNAVIATLTPVRSGAEPGTVANAARRAQVELDLLDADLTAVVLGRLLAAILECHHQGLSHSPRLATCLRTTARALRLDPDWNPPASIDQAA